MKVSICIAVFLLLSVDLFSQTIYPSGVSNCIARWTFDTTDVAILNSTIDKSGNGNNGTAVNIGSVEGFRNKANKAGKFNGVSSYAQIPHSSLLNPSQITIAALIKFNGFYNGLCQGNNIVYKGFNYNNDLSWSMYVAENDMDCNQQNPNKNKLMFSSPSYQYTPPQNNYLDTSSWYLLITKYDGTKTEFFEIKMDTTNHLSNVLPNFTNITNYPLGNLNYDVYIGATQNPNFLYWLNAVVDEIVVFNKALSNAEIQSVYDYLWGWNPNAVTNTTKENLKVQIVRNTINFIDEIPESIELFSVDSKLVYGVSCTTNRIDLPSNVIDGFYILKINNKDRRSVMKTVVITK